MKNALKKLSLLSVCALALLMGCSKQNGSLIVIDSIEPTSASVDNFNSYEKPQLFIGYQHLLKKDDRQSGVCFSSLASLTSYANELNNKNNEFDQIIESVSEEDFTNKKLIFTAEVSLGAGNMSLSFERMYFNDHNLNIALRIETSGDGGAAVMRYAVYTFFIDSAIAYNSVNTLVYK